MPDHLYVLSLGSPNTVKVPYNPDMPLYEYLKDVLVPALHSYTMHDGATVMESFVYNRPDGIQVMFARENRLDRLGDVVPPEAILHRMLTFLGPHNEKLHGNAMRGDFKQTCTFCMEDGIRTDYELQRCAHRFHVLCICNSFVHSAPGETLRCPLCREELCDEDEWGAWQIMAVRAEEEDEDSD